MAMKRFSAGSSACGPVACGSAVLGGWLWCLWRALLPVAGSIKCGWLSCMWLALLPVALLHFLAGSGACG